VYGKLGNAGLIEGGMRYSLMDKNGVDESTPLQFYSPYGCSKGAADQYVLDYSRIYGLKTVVFRQSCIYGTRQMGVEDQGWVAWFIIACALKKNISIYGNGKQVRDLLFVDDLIEAYNSAILKIDICSGEAFNIGGGPDNTLSLLELVEHLTKRFGAPFYSFEKERPGDQEIFICNLKKAENLLGWSPKVNVLNGTNKLMDWVENNIEMFRDGI
jgi:CDP-paratose 2-epimerase